MEQYNKEDHYEITYRMKCKMDLGSILKTRGHKICKPDGVIEHSESDYG
ncbi:MAG: hypothetical protein ACLTS6_15030 [Anaerobutyricum sp.]